jgi:pyochelin biosynthetic protein PchC
MSAAERWLRQYRVVPAPTLRLVCLPHAGGAASFFRDWGRWLPPGVELTAVRYPGREDRILDSAPQHAADLADEVAAALLPLPDVPTAIFGHSMGAVLGYEVAARLEDLGARTLVHVGVSGSAAPHVRPRRHLHDAPDVALIDEVRRIGHADTAVYEHPDLADLALYALRADFAMMDRYVAASTPAIACPVTAYTGSADEDCPADAVAQWEVYTRSRFELLTFPGGHFYLDDYAPDVVRALVRTSGRGIELRDDARP